MDHFSRRFCKLSHRAEAKIGETLMIAAQKLSHILKKTKKYGSHKKRQFLKMGLFCFCWVPHALTRTHTHLHALTHAESLTRTYTRALVCTQTHSLNPSKCDKKSNNKKIFLGKELSVGQTNIGRFIPLPNSLLLSLPPLSLSHSLSVSLTLSQSSQSSEGTEL